MVHDVPEVRLSSLEETFELVGLGEFYYLHHFGRIGHAFNYSHVVQIKEIQDLPKRFVKHLSAKINDDLIGVVGSLFQLFEQ